MVKIAGEWVVVVMDLSPAKSLTSPGEDAERRKLAREEENEKGKDEIKL